jgi:uncharacterized MAPEG superfamily protein
MTVAFWCVLAASLLPYLFTSYAKFTGPGFSNRKPREFLEKLEGARKRAHWTQLNSFESLPIFAAAVIIAHLAGADAGQRDLLAIVFVVSRILYGAFYIGDKPPLRSLAWFTGMGACVGLYVISAL